MNIACHECRRKKKTKQREQRRRLRHMTERDVGSRILHDQTCPFKTKERNEKADARTDGKL